MAAMLLFMEALLMFTEAVLLFMEAVRPFARRACYALSGTDPTYCAPGQKQPPVLGRFHRQPAPVRAPMPLRACYAMSGTERA
eukprot:958959-Rhodomonas_salina.3